LISIISNFVSVHSPIMAVKLIIVTNFCYTNVCEYRSTQYNLKHLGYREINFISVFYNVTILYLINFRDALTSFNGYYTIPSVKYKYVVIAFVAWQFKLDFSIFDNYLAFHGSLKTVLPLIWCKQHIFEVHLLALISNKTIFGKEVPYSV